MVKKYITQLKNRRSLLVLSAVVLISAIGVFAVAMLAPARTSPSTAIAYSAPPKVKGESTRQTGQNAKQSTDSTTNSAAAAPSSASTPASTQKTNSPTSTTPQNTASTPPAPPPAPAPAANLTIGILTFDDYYHAPMVIFSIPVSTDTSGSVMMVVTEDDNKATLCSQTLTFSADESENMQCGYTPTVPPNRVYATVSEGSTSVRPPTDAWEGGL